MSAETFLKIGKYGRPIFWAILMCYSFRTLMSMIFHINWLVTDVEGSIDFSGIVVFIFAGLIAIILFLFSLYWVTHPYVDSDLDNTKNGNWAVGLCLLVITIILLILKEYLYVFDFIRNFSKY